MAAFSLGPGAQFGLLISAGVQTLYNIEQLFIVRIDFFPPYFFPVIHSISFCNDSPVLCCHPCPAMWHLAVTPVNLNSLTLGISAALLISMACTPQEKLNTTDMFTASKSLSCHVTMFIFIYLSVAGRDCGSLIHHFPQQHVTLSCVISAEQIVWKR